MDKEKKYYQVKVKLHLEKVVTETYLVEAVSCTDAEAITIEDFKDFKQDFEITSVTETKIVKVL